MSRALGGQWPRIRLVVDSVGRGGMCGSRSARMWEPPVRLQGRFSAHTGGTEGQCSPKRWPVGG